MLVWNDIEKYKNEINNTKKLDGLNENDKLSKSKTNYNKNAFHFNHHVNDYGLNDKVTIKPFHVTYDQSFKNMFANKSTPSKMLKGKVELSSGTRRVIEMTDKMIPKIDHSYIDPGYYEHKLEGKTNKDLMLKNISKSKEFAKKFIEGMKPSPSLTLSPKPSPRNSFSSSPPPSPRDPQTSPKHTPQPPRHSIPLETKSKPPQSPIQKIGLDIKSAMPPSAMPPSPIKSKAEIIEEASQRDTRLLNAKKRLTQIQKNNVENKFKTPKSIPPPSTPASSLAPSPSVTSSPQASRNEIIINLVQDKIDKDYHKSSKSYGANMKSETLAEFQKLAEGLNIDFTNITTRRQIENALNKILKGK